MLDAYIIEEIKQREDERRRREELERPRLHIEIDEPRPPIPDHPSDENDEHDTDDDDEVHIDLRMARVSENTLNNVRD